MLKTRGGYPMARAASAPSARRMYELPPMSQEKGAAMEKAGTRTITALMPVAGMKASRARRHSCDHRAVGAP